MHDNIRQVAPISIAGLLPQQPPTGLPIFEFVSPTDLYIDPAYQRDVGDRGMAQIRRIVEGFDWTKFKPPICTYSEVDGKTALKVLDGQHTAIAAASNPHIQSIPVMIVDAEDIVAQAKGFIGQNTDRLSVTHLQLHQAALAAADEDAQTLELVCARAGIRVMKSLNSYTTKHGDLGARETVAIKTIEHLIKRRKAVLARQILEVIANAERGPITAPQIKAVEYLMTNDEFAGKFLPSDLTNAIVDMLYTAEDEAKIFAATHKAQFWRSLASVWFKNCKKVRPAAIRALS